MRDYQQFEDKHGKQPPPRQCLRPQPVPLLPAPALLPDVLPYPGPELRIGRWPLEARSPEPPGPMVPGDVLEVRKAPPAWED